MRIYGGYTGIYGNIWGYMGLYGDIWGSTFFASPRSLSASCWAWMMMVIRVIRVMRVIASKTVMGKPIFGNIR